VTTLDSDAIAIARAGIAAVRPDAAVRRSLKVTPRQLVVGGAALPLTRTTRVHLIAFGKAAAAMEDAAEELVGRRFAGGLAVLREGDAPPRGAIDVRYGEHPLPGPGSLRAARDVLRYVAACPEEDRVLFLISGGGSAILEAPDDGLSVPDLQRTTRALLACGAPIQAMNILRRHLSAVKGGRLGAATRAAQFATLVISDVVGDPPHDIASGPTVPDPTTFADAQRVVARYALGGRLPAPVLRHLEAGASGKVAETPKPGDARLGRAPFVIAASNRLALSVSATKARALGYATHILSREVVGETRDIGRLHGAILAAWSSGGPHGGGPTCLLSAGETTVTLPPDAGVGGRNQEFALSAAAPLAGLSAVHLLSVGTDGIDGPTDAAGGWVDGGTIRRAESLGLDLEVVLDHHATYGALQRLGQLVITGPTGTNVMDLHVGLSRGARGTAGSSRRSGARSSPRRRS
jgi:glycerate 2-kinase